MTKYIVFKGEVIPLTQDSKGVWTSPDGTIFAEEDGTFTKDPVPRCGDDRLHVNLGPRDPLNAICYSHDFRYNSPAYQMFHTRVEADLWLRDSILKLGGWRAFLAYPFYFITRIFGARDWENETTND